MLLFRVIHEAAQKYYNSVGRDPRTQDYPLVTNHVMILAILIAYVFVVRVVGPAFMAQRKAYNIKYLIQCYNVMQMLLNLYMFIGGINNYILHPQQNFTCMKLDRDDMGPKTMALRKYTFLYFVSKLLDLMETVFFVLRKKDKQISFLHIYHHMLMVYGAFVYQNFLYGSQFTMVGFLNSLVHVLMYIYYFLAALNTKLNLDAWKPRMTQIQIIQFALIAISLLIPLLNNWCGLSYFWLVTIFLQNAYMTLLFWNFYRKSYILKEQKAKTN